MVYCGEDDASVVAMVVASSAFLQHGCGTLVARSSGVGIQAQEDGAGDDKKRFALVHDGAAIEGADLFRQRRSMAVVGCWMKVPRV